MRSSRRCGFLTSNRNQRCEQFVVKVTTDNPRGDSAMGRLEKQLDPQTGPVAQLAVDLRELRRKAGSPTYREMSRVAGYSPSALSAAASGANLPSESVLSAYVRVCGGDVEEWLTRRAEAADPTSGRAPVAAPLAQPSTERPRVPIRQRFARRTAGLLAAAIMGSMATVVPM